MNKQVSGDGAKAPASSATKEIVGNVPNAHPSSPAPSGSKGALNAGKNADELLHVLDTCFVAGTPILTPAGAKPIEQFVEGDLVLSRSDLDPHGPVRPRTVEAVFALEGQVIELQIADRVVETTAKHSFYVHERGWVAARDLQPGDLLVGHDERLTPVVAVEVTERTTVVYNMRIAVDCTYFVGGVDWGFSAWVHNSYSHRPAADGTWELVNDSTGSIVRSGIADEATASGLAGFFNNVPDIRRVVNSSIQHAGDQAVARGVFSTKSEALQELRDLSTTLRRDGLPLGTTPDPGHVIPRSDSILVPIKNGAAVYEVRKNGTAALRTVLGPVAFPNALQRLGL